MIAKVVASAETRDLSIARLVSALRSFPILGVRTNIPFLLRVLEHARFRSGTVDTGFLDREGAPLAATPAAETPAFVDAVMAAHREAARFATDAGSAGTTDPWRSLNRWGRG